MHLSLRVALAALALAAPVTAAAQTALPTVLNGNQIKTASATVIFDPTGAPLGTTANPIKTTCISGCSGGGSGGTVTISGTPTVTISGTPSVGLSGTLPGFASTPTIYDPNTASLVSAMTAPINAQSTHGVNIGGIEGITAAGTAGSYPVTIQGNAAGVPVPVTPATNSAGVTSQVQSDSSASINVSTAATTQVVAASSGKVIYVTAWDVVVAAAENVTLEYGTGTNCGTGTTALTGPYPLAANGGLAKGSGLGVLFKVPAGNALCIVTSAATQASGSVSYAQF